MSKRSTTSNSRRVHRVVPEHTIPVVDSISHRLLGYAIDISAGGMRLIASEKMDVGTLYQVQFELQMQDGTRIPVLAGVELLRNQSAVSGHVIGLRFIHLGRAVVRQLEHWIAEQPAGM